MIKLQSKKNIIQSDSEEIKILRVSRNRNLPHILRAKTALLIEGNNIVDTNGFGMIFAIDGTTSQIPNILDKNLAYLEENDVIRVNPSTNSIKVIYRVNANANFLLVTERCNSFCLMCSQPPRKVNDGHLIEELIEAVPLITKGAKEIGITGGEPTLLGSKFVDLLRSLKVNLPDTSVHVLTNGRLFENADLIQPIADLKHKDLMFGIPLYSDISNIHDFVVQADNAFNETVRGIINLKRHSQKVEIRVVLHKQTYERLPQLAEFIGRNLQFVDHVALMGLEITGFTRANLEELWIEPLDYMPQLERAISILNRSKVRASIYNLQRCLLPKILWSYAVKSISDWKNKYYDECNTCSQKSHCGGFFESSDIRRSQNIKAI